MTTKAEALAPDRPAAYRMAADYAEGEQPPRDDTRSVYDEGWSDGYWYAIRTLRAEADRLEASYGA